VETGIKAKDSTKPRHVFAYVDTVKHGIATHISHAAYIRAVRFIYFQINGGESSLRTFGLPF